MPGVDYECIPLRARCATCGQATMVKHIIATTNIKSWRYRSTALCTENETHDIGAAATREAGPEISKQGDTV